MTWAKFDDRYDDNRKVKKAWRNDPAAIGLHAMAITYSSRHETDGIVDLDWLSEKMPAGKAREKTVAALVDAGLFEPIDGERFQVHDYLDFNPSSARLDEKRRKDSERKRQRAGVGLQTESEPNPGGIHAESTRNPNGGGGESSWSPNGIPAPHAQGPPPAARPVPARPAPSR